jgi:predicted nucleic acid-binding Zn ribbon protein
MIKKLLVSTVLAFNFSLPIIAAAPVAAATTQQIVCDQADAIDSSACNQSSDTILSGFAGRVVRTLILIIGAVSVLVIVIAGMMYVFSGGDPNNTKRAKDAIIYAVIGLVIALLAQAIVSFVINRVG